MLDEGVASERGGRKKSSLDGCSRMKTGGERGGGGWGRGERRSISALVGLFPPSRWQLSDVCAAYSERSPL